MAYGGRVSDPLAHSLPWLDLLRKLIPVGKYLAAREQARRRIREREAAEAMRRGGILLAQFCMLHGHPQDTSVLEAESPLWCGCAWQRDVIYTRSGKPQRVIHVIRRDPTTGNRLAITFADTGEPPTEDVLEQAREAFAIRETGG